MSSVRLLDPKAAQGGLVLRDWCPVGLALKWWRGRSAPSTPEEQQSERDAAEQELRRLARERRNRGGWFPDRWKN